MEAADVVRGRRGGRRGSQGRLDDGEARRIAALGALGTIKHAKVGSCLNTSGWQPLANNTLVTELTTCIILCTTSTKYYSVPSK